MSSISWWRSWHGAPMDHKWSVIAARSGVKAGIVSAVAWAMLDYASQQKERGSVEGFDAEEYAVFSGFSEGEIVAVIKAMIDKGIIVNNCFANWEKRQPKREDESTERVRDYRERNALKRDVTHGNASEKEKENRLKSTDTESDTDKETDTETETEGAARSFSDMQRMVETLTGYPATPRDEEALDEFVERGVTEDDVREALVFLRNLSSRKIIRGAADLRGSVFTALGKRVQGAVSSKSTGAGLPVFQGRDA